MTRLMAVTGALLLSACSGPLDDLAKTHPSGAGDKSLELTRGDVLLLSPRHRGAFSYHGAQRAFTEEGIALELAPFGFTKRLWIPATAITGCSRTWWSGHRYDTNFWVEDAQVLVSVPDNDDRFVQWCKDRGLTVFDRARESQWLHER